MNNKIKLYEGLVDDVELEGAISEVLIALMDRCSAILMDRGCFVSLDVDECPEDVDEEIELELDMIEYNDNHIDDISNGN